MSVFPNNQNHEHVEESHFSGTFGVVTKALERTVLELLSQRNGTLTTSAMAKGSASVRASRKTGEKVTSTRRTG